MTGHERAQAADLMFRVLTVGLGLGGATILALNLPNVAGSATRFEAWWAVGSPAVFAVGTVLLLAGRWWPPAITRTIAGGLAVSYVGLLLAMPVARVDGTGPESSTPWILNLALLGTAGVVAFRGRAAAVYLAVLAAALLGVGLVLSQADPTRKVFLDSVFNVFYVTLTYAVAFATLRAGRLLDLAQQRMIEHAARAGAISARAHEESRVHSVIHDQVIGALLAFARGHAPAAQVQRMAATALEALEKPPAVGDGTPWDAQALVWRIQAVVTDLDPGIRVRSTVDRSAASFPAEVVDEVEAALTEAVRNSLRHADPTGERSVTRVVGIEASAHGLTVRMLDDGVGFDLARVGADRLGVRLSILGRLHDLPGGSAVITSGSNGTLVELTWHRP